MLRFGMLYHPPNPVRLLEVPFDNLRPGAYLPLETQVYDHAEDPNICYFMHMQNNDQTNFWALSTSVLTKWLELVGFAKFDSYLRSFPRRDLRNTCRGSSWSRENRNDLRLSLASILSEHGEEMI